MLLETQRLILRRWKEDDREPFRRLNADPEVLRFFPSLLSSEQSDNLVNRIETNMEEWGFGLWAVEVKGGPEFIGFTGFSYPHFDCDFADVPEIGWRLAKEAWGRGYATEAAAACLEYGFKEIELNAVCSFAPVINTPSIRVMEKIGLHKKTEFDHPSIAKDHPINRHVLYWLEREEYLR